MSKKLIKNLSISFLLLTVLISINFILKDINKNSIPVLMYHNVINKSDVQKKYLNENGEIIYPYTVSTEKFEHQMDILKENNVKTLTIDEFYDYVIGEKEIPKNTVLITFDDGYKNNYVNAYPILKKRNQKALIFLITSKINKKEEIYTPLKTQFLSFDEIEKSKDVFDFGSHTNDFHKREKDTNEPYLKSKTEKEVKNDIKESLKYVNKPFFAYPYGSYNKKLFKIIKDSGIKAAFITHKGKVKSGDNLYSLKRNIVEENYSDEKFKKIIGLK